MLAVALAVELVISSDGSQIVCLVCLESIVILTRTFMVLGNVCVPVQRNSFNSNNCCGAQ